MNEMLNYILVRMLFLITGQNDKSPSMRDHGIAVYAHFRTQQRRISVRCAMSGKERLQGKTKKVNNCSLCCILYQGLTTFLYQGLTTSFVPGFDN